MWSELYVENIGKVSRVNIGGPTGERATCSFLDSIECIAYFPHARIVINV